MAFELPDLPYAFDALEPHIDARTMEIHHDKHHNAYTTKFNAAIEGQSALAGKSAEQILGDIKSVPDSIRQTVINNGGGFVNHSMFWQIMGPNCGGSPGGAIGEEIKKVFGSFDALKEQFAKQAMGRFGSGWAWMGLHQGKLHVGSTANQDSPYMNGHVPVLGLDVWEHAYYLNYQNRRPDYITAFWNVVNWKKVDELFVAAKG
jgi:Fe-Mn family superoxide dismutase